MKKIVCKHKWTPIVLDAEKPRYTPIYWGFCVNCGNMKRPFVIAKGPDFLVPHIGFELVGQND